MSPKLHLWLSGALAALISGASGGVTASLGALVVSPETFNAGHGLRAIVHLAVISALVSAAAGLAGYLKQSPLPPKE